MIIWSCLKVKFTVKVKAGVKDRGQLFAAQFYLFTFCCSCRRMRRMTFPCGRLLQCWRCRPRWRWRYVTPVLREAARGDGAQGWQHGRPETHGRWIVAAAARLHGPTGIGPVHTKRLRYYFVFTEWKGIFLWSLSLLNVNIKLDSIWTNLERMSLSLSLYYKRTLTDGFNLHQAPTYCCWVWI